jgi:hypothetical protein
VKREKKRVVASADASTLFGLTGGLAPLLFALFFLLSFFLLLLRHDRYSFEKLVGTPS